MKRIRVSSLLLATVSLIVVANFFPTASGQPIRGGREAGEGAPPKAVELAGPDAESLLHFRRYFIPSSRQAEVTSGYLPLRRERFEELLDEVRRKRSAEQSQVHLLRARYFAVLDGHTLRGGFAHLEFHNPSSTPLSTRLTPLGIALGEAVWELPNWSRAELGANPEGEAWVVVPHSGRLIVPWSLRGDIDDNREVSFRLRLPSSPSSQLIAALPRNMIPSTDEGLVAPWRGTPEDWEGSSEAEEFAATDTELYNFWQIDLGGTTEATVRFSPGGGDEVIPPFVNVRHADQYTCYASRVELQSELTLDVYRATTEGLVVRLDDQVVLLDARLGDEPITWIVDELPEEQQRRYQLQFPRSLQGTGHSLRLTIHSPLIVDRPWTLPRVECERVFWQEARAELIFPDGLELERLVTRSCVQTKVNALPQGVTSLTFQCYRPDYDLDVTWRHRAPRLNADVGTTIRIDSEVIAGEVVGDFQAEWGEVFAIRARVPKPWELDRIEVEPASALALASGAWQFKEGFLEIPLREPITSERPLRIRVEGHRAAPPDMSGLRVEQMEFLQFTEVPRINSLIRVHANSPLQVKLVEDGDLPRVDPRGLTPEELQRLGEGMDGSFFRRNEAPSTLTALVAQDTPSFVAESRVEAILDAPQLTESYRILCTPESLPIRKIRVQLSQIRSSPVIWRLAGHDEPLNANLLPTARQAEEGEPRGESWEIELPLPQSSVFELLGERTMEMEEPTSIGLASLPQAVSESGRIAVRSHQAVKLSYRGLEPLPLEPVPSDQYPLVRGNFRYQPSHTDQLTVRWDEDSPWPQAWVWAAHYTSRVVGDRLVVHDALFRIQNSGAEAVECEIPAELQSLVVFVDDRRVAEVAERGILKVNLPPSRRFPTIRLRYRTAAHSTWSGARVSVPFPRFRLPTVATRWSVLTGVDDQIISHSSPRPALSDADGMNSWRDRLLGPLSRRPGQVAAREQSLSHGENSGPPGRIRSSVPPRSSISWRGNVSWTRDGLHAPWITPLELLGNSEQLTWQEFLNRLERLLIMTAPPDSTYRLVIDEYALGMTGIQGTSFVPEVFGSSPLNRTAAEMLDEQELQVLTAGNLYVVTTRHMANTYRSQLVRPADLVEEGPADVRRDGWLYQLLHDEESGASGFPAVTAWTSRQESLLAPWGYVDASEHSVAHARQGWTIHAFDLDLQADDSAELVVVRGVYLRQGAWMIFLLAAAGGVCLGRVTGHGLTFSVVLAAIVALLVPDDHMTWGAAGFLGTLAGWCYVAARPIHSPSLTGDKAFSGYRKQFAWGATVLLALWFSFPVAAQENGGRLKFPELQSGEFPVLIPIDSKRETVGSYVYVPRTFYDFVYRYLDAESEPYDWLFRKATYTAQYSTSTAVEGAGISSITALFQVETFQAHQWIRIPFKRRELQVIDAKLGGQPAEVRWSSDEEELLVMAVQAGVHELSLVLGTRRLELDSELNLSIPSIPESKLIVRELPVSVRLEPVGALGATRTQDGRLEVELGPVHRLTLRRMDVRRTEMSQVEVEEFAWLRVRPGATVLEVRLHVTSEGGQLENLSLLADSRLRLLPVSAGQPIEGEPVVSEGDYQQIRLRLRETIGPRFSLQLSFLVSNASGVGQLRLPRWETLGAHRRSRMLAVSHAPTLQFHDVRFPTLQKVEPAKFLESWGRDNEVPWGTYEMPASELVSDQDWYAESRFLPSSTSVNQQTRVHITRESVSLTLEAVLTTTGSPAFQRRLRVPPQLEVRDVAVVEGDSFQSLRFRNSASGELTVFLPTAAETRQRLVLNGRIPLQGRSVVEFPLVKVLDAKQEGDVLELYRDIDVESVTLQHAESWIRQNAARPRTTLRMGSHWIGTWNRPAESLSGSPPALVIYPNQRRGEGMLATRLLRSSEGWRVEAEYHLHVQQGLYDMVRFELSADWLPPLELDPPHPFELRQLPGQNRQQLIIRPPTPVSESYTVKIRGALSAVVDRIQRVPDLQPLDVTHAERFLVVPSRLETQQISWTTSGLQTRSLPDLFQMAREQTDAWESYHVLGTHFHATIRHVERVAGFPQVRLADIHVAWRQKGYHGIATFDLEPAGRSHCLVFVPPGVELLKASLDGVPAQLDEVASRRQRISLGPRLLPQRLELLFRGSDDIQYDENVQLLAPFCEDLPVARTLWTVRVPASQQVEWTDSVESRVGSVRQELMRMESLAALVDLAYDAAAEIGAEEADNWMRVWAPRIGTSRSKIRHLRDSQSYVDIQGLDERLEATEESWRAESRRFGRATVAMLLNESARESRDPVQAWDEATRGLHRDLRFMFPGTAESIQLRAAKPASGWLHRAFLAGLLLTGSLVAAVARGRMRRLEFGGEHPQFLLAVVGILLALWMTPAWFGIGLTLLAVLSAWRHPWASLAS